MKDIFKVERLFNKLPGYGKSIKNQYFPIEIKGCILERGNKFVVCYGDEKEKTFSNLDSAAAFLINWNKNG